MAAGGIDLHMHSNASDGTDTPEQLAERAKAAGIRTMALTDHDTVKGAEELKDRVPDGMVFYPGIEFSCMARAGKCHILGYCCDTGDPLFQDILDLGHRKRRAKLETRIAWLKKNGIVLTEAEVEELYRMPSAGKPHLGNLIVKHGRAETKDEAIRVFLNPIPEENTRISAKSAVTAILSSGGIPVWAHPMGGEGEKPLSQEQFEALLTELLSYGIQGMECYYSRYGIERCEALAETARKNGLRISGGSDCHGRNKNIEPGTLNASGVEIPAEKLTILEALTACQRK